jgi:hypothetical protein
MIFTYIKYSLIVKLIRQMKITKLNNLLNLIKSIGCVWFLYIKFSTYHDEGLKTGFKY